LKSDCSKKERSPIWPNLFERSACEQASVGHCNDTGVSGMTTIGEPAQSPNRISTAEVIVDPMVYVVDDDRLMREMLSSLFRSVGLRVRLFESAKELLQSELEDAPSCLVLD